MRPPLSSTPPISEMVPHRPRPLKHDWSALTSNSSIQILQLSSADHTYNECDVTYTIDLIETIHNTSPDPTLTSFVDSNPGMDPCELSVVQTETLVSLDSLKRHPGYTMDARIVFTKGNDVIASIHDTDSNKVGVANDDIGRKMTRNTYSESDMICGRSSENMNYSKIANVIRSKSLGYNEHVNRRQEQRLLQPLRPCAYKSKTGNVKRLSCITEKENLINTATLLKSQVTNSDEKPKECKVLRTSSVCHTESLRRTSLLDAQRNKLAKLVKSGLKTIIKTRNTYDISSEITTAYDDDSAAVVKERRSRKLRKTTDIGGLSDFLRRNERRKTLASFPEAVESSFGSVNEVLLETEETEDVVETKQVISNLHSKGRSDLKYTPKPWTGELTLGINKINSTGTTNLKFANCQRKLVFNTKSKVGNPEVNQDCDDTVEKLPETAEEWSENMLYSKEDPSPVKCVQSPHILKEEKFDIDIKEDTQPTRRPRLGILGFSKPVTVVPIDELEMDIVRDLKRRVDKANRVSRIKTNGSLKSRPKLGQLQKLVIQSPRNYALTKNSKLMSSFSLGLNQVRPQKESFV